MSRIIFRLFLIFLIVTQILAYNPSGMPTHFPAEGRKVALTLDDGPSYLYTERILDVLKKYGVKASFFLIGERMIEHPEMVRRIYLEGHDLGNHTYNHLRLDKFADQRVDYEIAETNRVFENILGFVPEYFRPPGGRFNQTVLNTVEYYGLTPIGWSINANDFLYENQYVNEEYVQRRVSAILALLERNLKPGAIILMHNGSLISLAVLPKMIEHIQSQGYEFVILSDYF